MSRKIFVNLPVRGLKKARAFFSELGFRFNEQFSDDTGACMVISEENFAMLLTHEKFAGFAPNPISDAGKVAEVLIALSCESREEVGTMVRTATSGSFSGWIRARPIKAESDFRRV